MEKLMKPAEYAKELGISRQAVYAKIKRGILKAKDVEGKLYIVVDAKEEKNAPSVSQTETQKKSSQNNASKAASKSEPLASDVKQEYEALLAAKDETISVLKGTVKDLKKSNKQITTTLKGEIDLLKEAFYEMRTLYMHQIEHKSPETIDIATEAVVEEEREYVSLKKLFKTYGITSEKKKEKIQKRLKKAYKAGDPRIVKEAGKLRVDALADYGDIF
jgi:transcriptional regulator of acetoin/glycerol metabolism